MVGRVGAAAGIVLVAAGLVGCEHPLPKTWIQNDSDQIIVVRKLIDQEPGHMPGTTVAPHQTLEAQGMVSKGSCTRYWEIVDVDGNRLRYLEQVCDASTVKYP